MAPCEVAEPSSAFAFNASASEFYPWCPDAQWLQAQQQHWDAEAADDGDVGSKSRGTGRSRRSRKTSNASDATTACTAAESVAAHLGDGQAAAGGMEALESAARRSRRSTSAAEAPGQVATLVVKNLALDLEKEALLRFLIARDVTPLEVELHRDASGSFRGTAFVRYSSSEVAKATLDKLGTCVELGGRRARIEIQRAKALIGRRSLEAELPSEELTCVRKEIERFLADGSATEMRLPANFSVQQRKYAHSLAERHSLGHATSQGETGEKFVQLSKARRGQRQQELMAAPARGRANTTLADGEFGEGTFDIDDTFRSGLATSSTVARKKKVRSTTGTALPSSEAPPGLAHPFNRMAAWSPASAPTPVISPMLMSGMPSPAFSAVDGLVPPGFESADGGLILPPPGLWEDALWAECATQWTEDGSQWNEYSDWPSPLILPNVTPEAGMALMDSPGESSSIASALCNTALSTTPSDAASASDEGSTQATEDETPIPEGASIAHVADKRVTKKIASEQLQDLATVPAAQFGQRRLEFRDVIAALGTVASKSSA